MMRLMEIKNNYTLYVDMDGVIVDFEKTALDLIGEPINQKNKSLFWKTVRSMEPDKVVEYWASMDWTPDGKYIWNFVSKYSPIILSSPGNTLRELVEEGKTVWINKNLKPKPNGIIYETEKEKYANNYSIIIDDRSKVIDPWRSAGGIGIQHVTGKARDTIEQLKQILGE